jgi:hypothetical protein
MSSQLIQLLTICLLLLIYLFFFRVLRAIWEGVKPSSELAHKKLFNSKQPKTPKALMVRTPETQRGTRHQLDDELTIGRAAGCHLTIDDSYASQHHARIFRQEERLLIEDLGSTNGTYLNRQKVNTVIALKLGDQIQVGSTVFEVMS